MEQTVDKPSLETLIENKNFRSMVDALSYKAIRSSYRFSQSHPVVSRQDLIAEGLAAACAVYKNFDPAKGAWHSYTYMYVQNAMQTYCKKFCHPLSISEKESRDHLADMTGIGVVRIDQGRDHNGDECKFDIPVGSGVEVGEHEIDEFYFRGFAPLEVAILKDHVLEEKTMQEISFKYNISKSNVYTIINRMLTKMKERIEYNESQD